MQIQTVNADKHSALFDPELPTAKEVMAAMCCVATQYALNPTLEMAKSASSLAHKLTAPEYAETKLIVEIAKRMVFQWDEVLREHLYIETQLMPVNNTMQ
jgi:hypothetical protein